MTCDEFLAAMETGGRVQRWQARRHAATCPSCAAAMRMLETVKQELASAPPLTAGVRARWLSAARVTEPVSVAWRWRVACAMAATVLIAFGTWRILHRAPARPPSEIVQADAAPLVTKTGPILVVKAEPAAKQ